MRTGIIGDTLLLPGNRLSCNLGLNNNRCVPGHMTISNNDSNPGGEIFIYFGRGALKFLSLILKPKTHIFMGKKRTATLDFFIFYIYILFYFIGGGRGFQILFL